MANVHIPDQERRETTNRIMEQYGVNKNNSEMREAAEIVAVRQQEAINKANTNRRYFV